MQFELICRLLGSHSLQLRNSCFNLARNFYQKTPPVQLMGGVFNQDYILAGFRLGSFHQLLETERGLF
jgi:hypothetical protein